MSNKQYIDEQIDGLSCVQSAIWRLSGPRSRRARLTTYATSGFCTRTIPALRHSATSWRTESRRAISQTRIRES
jgi:hypothetical protein